MPCAHSRRCHLTVPGGKRPEPQTGAPLPELPPIHGDPHFNVTGKGKAKRQLQEQLLDAVQGAYERARQAPPPDRNNRFEATFGVDPSLPWLDFHDQAMRNFVGYAGRSWPFDAGRTAKQAYDAYYDPEHPVTQSKQSTKDAAFLSTAAAMQLAMPWIANTWGRDISPPAAASKHPGQTGANFHNSLPAMLAAWYGIKPSR